MFSAICRRLPNESLVYLGDTARVPYGTKSAETVIRYSRECASFLMSRGVKAIVIACNTSSAYALHDLSGHFDIPILGVIEPGIEAALSASKNRHIGVIGTSGTIVSNAYGSALKKKDVNVRVVSRACPMFVPLVEEGWVDNEISQLIAKKYLEGMSGEGIDTMILGCTHYPLLRKVIQSAVGDAVKLVDSAETTAIALKKLLDENGINASDKNNVSNRIYVTDLPSRFETLAGKFLNDNLPIVTRVDL